MIRVSVRTVVRLVALVCFLAGSVAAVEPDQVQIAAYLRGQLPHGLALQDIRFKTFPGGTGSGRISVAGTLNTTEPWVEQEPRGQSRFKTELARRGVTADRFQRYIDQVSPRRGGAVQRPVMYRITHAVAAVVPFTAEISYWETVDGYNWQSRITHEARQQPQSGIGPLVRDRAVFYDTPGYERLVNQMMARFEHETVALPAKANRFFHGLTEGMTLVQDGVVIATIAPLDVAGFQWLVERNYLSGGGEGLVLVQGHQLAVRSVVDRPIRFDRTEIAPRGQAVLSVGIRLDYDDPAPLRACISVGTGGGMCRSGKGFSAPLGKRYALTEAISRQPVAIMSGAYVAPRPVAATPEPAEPVDVAALLAGEWVSSEHGYSMVITGTSAVMGARTNSPKLPPGTEILRITGYDPNGFVGKHRFSDNKWSGVSGVLVEGGLRIQGGGATWTMVRADGDAPATVDTVVTADGIWVTPDGKWMVQSCGASGKVVISGGGVRRAGTDILRITGRDGTALTGQFRMSNGQWTALRADVNGDALNLSAGGFAFEWQRK